MPRLLALEWDSSEARVAVARSRAGDMVVEQAFAFPLPGDGPPDETLKAEFERLDIGRLDALVSIGRASIELRQLKLPHAPLNELPDLVRFQAMRQFANIGDDWTLDYIHVDTGDDESFNVLAAAISPDMVEQFRKTCLTAGLEPKSFVLRPFAAASLLRRTSGDDGRCRLLVDLLSDEADLTIMVDRYVVFMRTVRLAGDHPDSRFPVLIAEIRRTMAAAQNQLGGRRVERIVLCGAADEHGMLQEMARDQLSLEVDLYNPLDSVQVSRELARSLPENPGRFAPLLGMLLDETSGAGHNIDFLNPRRKAEPPNRKRMATWIVAAAASILLLIAGLIWSSLARMDSDIEELARQSAGLDATVKKSDELRRDVADVEQFLAGDVAWLDQLSDLSAEFPPAEHALVTQFTANSENEGGGIVVDAYVSDPELLDQAEAALRDPPRRSIVRSGVQEDPKRKSLPWRFKEAITVRPGEAAAANAEDAP